MVRDDNDEKDKGVEGDVCEEVEVGNMELEGGVCNL